MDASWNKATLLSAESLDNQSPEFPRFVICFQAGETKIAAFYDGIQLLYSDSPTEDSFQQEKLNLIPTILSKEVQLKEKASYIQCLLFVFVLCNVFISIGYIHCLYICLFV